MSGMKILADWLEQGSNATPEEAATVARVKISVGGRYATDMRTRGQNTLVDHVIVPAYPLAEAIAYRWWSLVFGRGRSIKLRSIRAGFALPDIVMTGMGSNRVDISCEPFSYTNPPVDFVTGVKEEVSVKDFADEMGRFLKAVSARLIGKNVKGTPLSQRWNQILSSMNDREERAFCEAAGALGVDPYACDEDVAEFIEEASHLFQNDALGEFLAGMKGEPRKTNSDSDSDEGWQAFAWLRNAERNLDGWAELPGIQACRQEIRFEPIGRPWTVGYASARKARKTLNASDSEPLDNLDGLATLFGNRGFNTAEPSRSALRGVSRIRKDVPCAIVSGHNNPATELFATSRTIGDAIHFGNQFRSPVTDQIGTYRQQLGRAFAAEFLAPVQAVLEMHGEGKEIEEIASHFGVSDMVIHHQIQNQAEALPTQG
jgi:uncharacterized protein (DUF433 family)